MPMTAFTPTVNNVPPLVDAGPDAAIDEGDIFLSAGSFTDPGADTWTATVDYGDGSGVQPLALNPDGTFALGHVYADDGLYTVTVTVTDDDGGAGSDTAIVTVNNVAPLVDAGPDDTINEGDTFVSAGSFSDPGADTWTATVDYGDGSAVQPLPLNPDKTFELSHVYADDGVYTVTVTVTDDEGGSGSDTAIVTVNNVAPLVDAGPDDTINEGDTFVSAGSFTDPGADTWTATVDYGEGAGPQTLPLNPDNTFALNNVYEEDGVYTVTVTVTDDEGGVGIDTAIVTVNNVPPLVDAGPDATINEGDTFLSAGSFSDPGADIWTGTVDYGEGAGPQTLPLNPDKTFALSHTYADDGVYTVTVTVSDDDGGVGIDTATVTVNNIPPQVDAGPDATIDEGDTFVSAGSFTDPGADTWTATVDYGDGSGTQTLPLNPDKTFALSHTYADDGVYTVTVSVSDDDGGVGSDTATVTVNPGGVVQCINDLTARPKSGKVQIVWTHENDAESYNVYRSTTSGVKTTPANRIAENHVTTYATYLDTNVVNGTTYYYKVTKIVGGDEDCVSNEASATPQARTRTR
jgi:PKD repeat protein